MSWEQEISQLLQEAQSIAVRCDVNQNLTDNEKTRSRNNMGVTASATNLSGDDYAIVFNY